MKRGNASSAKSRAPRRARDGSAVALGRAAFRTREDCGPSARERRRPRARTSRHDGLEVARRKDQTSLQAAYRDKLNEADAPERGARDRPRRRRRCTPPSRTSPRRASTRRALAADVADHLNAARGAKTPRGRPAEGAGPLDVSGGASTERGKKRRRADDTSSRRRRDDEARAAGGARACRDRDAPGRRGPPRGGAGDGVDRAEHVARRLGPRTAPRRALVAPRPTSRPRRAGRCGTASARRPWTARPCRRPAPAARPAKERSSAATTRRTTA